MCPGSDFGSWVDGTAATAPTGFCGLGLRFIVLDGFLSHLGLLQSWFPIGDARHDIPLLENGEFRDPSTRSRSSDLQQQIGLEAIDRNTCSAVLLGFAAIRPLLP